MAEKTKALIDSLRIGPEKNFCYLIMSKVTGAAALIDPSFDFDKIRQWVDNIGKLAGLTPTVKYFLATHGHWDHAGGFNDMAKIYPHAKVCAHKLEEARLKELELHLDIPLDEKTPIVLDDVTIEVYHTPGHTVGGCCYKVENQLFSGDTLFIGQCGRTDLKGGSDDELFTSLQKLKTLPRNLVVRPGHDYGKTPMATLESELNSNPTLLVKTVEEFRRLP